MRIPFVKRAPAAVAAVAGGWLMLVGAFLSWFTLSLNPAQQVVARFHSNAAAITGVSTTAGKVALGAGIGATVAVVLGSGGAWLAIGIAVGIVIGLAMSKRKAGPALSLPKRWAPLATYAQSRGRCRI